MQHIGHLESQKYGLTHDVITKVEDNDSKVVSITVNNLYKKEILEILKREIQLLINIGFVNIILDLGKVKSIEINALNIIVYAYKSCSEKKGVLKLCGISEAVNESLSYVFLNNIIRVFKDKESALTNFQKETSLK